MLRFFVLFNYIYSSFTVFILNNLNISTITIGANTKPTVSIIFDVGNTGILNTCLNSGINNIINTNAAAIAIAPNNQLFPPIPV